MGTHSWTWFLLSAFFFHLANQTVFLSNNDANKVIARSKRGSSMFLEEIFEGNLERECLEERCSYEEAREAFEDIENTDQFWVGYFGGVRCSSSPCLHNSVCKDSIRSYTCECTDGFEGINCAFDKCACGRLEDYILTQLNATKKNHRGFPWQVLLLNAEGKLLCGGVLLKTNFVLTTAECALLSPVTVVVGINKLQRGRQVISVKQMNIHIRYESNTGENNLALLELSRHINCDIYHLPICVPEKDFAEHVLISGLAATLSGWKVVENQSTDPFAEQSVSYLNENECKGILNRSLITREYCGYSNEGAGELLAGGSFSAVDYKGTWFLTGILEPRATEASMWETLIFTKTTRYKMWFKRIMD
nr:vitamin K-dependent protein Z isoform X2 [Anolis sagrei ordinatus]